MLSVGARIPMEDIKSYMKQILTGMAYVHRQQIFHRDLKPENILLNHQGVVKICDFGSAKFLNDKLNTPYIVSRYYRAPELILACSDYNEKIDVWAIGCIFYEFLKLMPLFPGKTEGSQLIEQIAILGLPSKETMFMMSKQMSPNTVELVHKLDDMPPQSIADILPFKDYSRKDIEEAADLIQKMLQWVPNQRISCEDALKHPFFKGVQIKH
jgi:serine/threonine protein kinase